MFENKTSTNTNFLASFLFKSGATKSSNSLLNPQNQKGTPIGLEAESKKGINDKFKLCSPGAFETFEDDAKSISSHKSTDISDRSCISPAKSILGKRRGVSFMEGCNEIENYSLLNYIHEGVYGAVYRARDQETQQIYAIKKVKFFHQQEGFPITSLREINLLKSLHHPNIVNIKEVVMGKSLSEIFLVMDYADHELRHLLQSSRYNLSVSEIKCLLKQLLEAVSYMHSKDIVHRDLKTSNLLYTEDGVLKVCDFGLSRKMNGSGSLTPTVVTLTYRAPELLLGCEKYTSAIDMWAVGCIFAELLLGEPLFKGRNEIEQIDHIFRTMGTPSTSTWPDWKQYKLAGLFEGMKRVYNGNEFYSTFAGLSFNGGVYVSDEGIDLLEQLLTYDPAKRITAAAALKHPWFAEEPLACEVKEMPKFSHGTNEVERETEVITKKVFAVNNKFSQRIVN